MILLTLSADAENDIRNAVSAGKIATAHETRLNVNGWVGEGYTLIDPNTGAGAYMISGGGNGGYLSTMVAGLLGYLDGLTQTSVTSVCTLHCHYDEVMDTARQMRLLGGLALVADIASVFLGDDLSFSSTLGRISLALFSFGAGSVVAGSLYFLGGIALAALGGLVFAILLSVLLAIFADIYFSYQNRSDRVRGNRRELIC